MSGYKPGSTQFGSIGAVFGEKSHTQTVSEMPSHTHIQDSHSHPPPAGHSSFAGNTYGYSAVSWYFPGGSGWLNANAGNTGYTQATNQYTGGGQAFNVIQPTRAVLVVIKT